MKWPWSKKKEGKKESAITIRFIEYPEVMVEVSVKSEESYYSLLDSAKRTAFEMIDKKRGERK